MSPGWIADHNNTRVGLSGRRRGREVSSQVSPDELAPHNAPWIGVGVAARMGYEPLSMPSFACLSSILLKWAGKITLDRRLTSFSLVIFLVLTPATCERSLS